ncbi:MAG TPA: hypothetical protein VFX43_08045 [Chitinophagaceae bacterium]|nr:hypothetical protein [Chitinophagaceae bacterium]
MTRKLVKLLTDHVVSGSGKNVPPLKEHVKIYFQQKGCSEYEAMEFYQHFEDKQWINNRGGTLSNWKTAAWEWILKWVILNKVTKQKASASG